ncbi:hypothetical protein CK203_087923 [Vitis vinifera]|uniref:Uncharacterized protein n=1 Tax=Vitis vinifera TaxID=29760 RepID=A0A438D7X3_VITVI|nr:hypothetical protein CK203_087923 [Vitis vinifera]
MWAPTKKFSNGLLFCCWLVRYCNSSKSSSFTNLYHDILNWGSAHHNIYSRASS